MYTSGALALAFVTVTFPWVRLNAVPRKANEKLKGVEEFRLYPPHCEGLQGKNRVARREDRGGRYMGRLDMEVSMPPGGRPGRAYKGVAPAPHTLPPAVEVTLGNRARPNPGRGRAIPLGREVNGAKDASVVEPEKGR